MDSYFHNQFPFYEVWYGKLVISPQEAFWFRYTLLNGKTKESAVWAIYFNNDRIISHKKTYALSDISISPDIRLPSGVLNDHEVQGNLPQIQWDFTYHHKNESFDPVPFLFKFLHLTHSLTKTPVTNAQFTGTLTINGKNYSLYNSRGMIGRVWGKKQAHEWTWAHCNTFQQEGVIFEGLSARVLVLKCPSPPLTALYLKYDGKEYFFKSPIDLFKTQSTFGYTFWNFSAHHKNISIQGKVKSSPQKIATIHYTDTDDSHLYCHNSKLAQIEISIKNKKTQKTTLLTSQSAALEWVTRK